MPGARDPQLTRARAAARVSIAAASLLLLAVAAACGGGGGDDDRSVAAIAEVIAASPSFPGGEEDARCIAAALVDELGPGGLAEVGLAPDDLGGDPAGVEVELDGDDADAVGERIGRCGGVRALFLEAIAAEVTVDEASAVCLDGAVDDALIGSFFAARLRPPDQARDLALAARLAEVTASCPGVAVPP